MLVLRYYDTTFTGPWRLCWCRRGAQIFNNLASGGGLSNLCPRVVNYKDYNATALRLLVPDSLVD